MKICMLGSGSLGSAIGGVLAEAGQEVYLIRRSPEHVKAINASGLRLREDFCDRVVQVRAATDCQGIGTVDLVIVLVKSYHTRVAVESARPIIGEHTVVLSLQNGFGNEETISELVGPRHVLGGRTYVGGKMLAPGHVLIGVKGKQTILGELDGSVSERVRRIAAEFNWAGLPTEVTTNIVGTMWDKLLVNVATGALSGITRLPYGGLYRVPEVRECALAAVAEAMAVARASGVELATRKPEDAWITAAEGLPDEFKASILQSIENGLPTEVDYINGSVVRCGEKCQVPTPVNRALVAGIKGVEYWLKHYAAQPALGEGPAS